MISRCNLIVKGDPSIADLIEIFLAPGDRFEQMRISLGIEYLHTNYSIIVIDDSENREIVKIISGEKN